VYWVDGSYIGGNAGFSAAAVVWRDGEILCTATYKLGQHTGNSEDAEVYAIAAALRRAKREIENGNNLRLVRIYSDSLSSLKGLKNGTLHTLGPLIARRTVLQAIHERTAWLTNNGARVELIWVKGHAASEGNKAADQTATRATSKQDKPPIGQLLTHEHVPKAFKDLGQDWADEWLWRANQKSMNKTHMPSAEEKN
ncbi:hypothetical protein EK21DRAFT_74610, partial [Setomelanomma holmii]